MLKSNYKIEELSDDKLIIRDIGPHDKYATVTNDVDNVVKTLYETGHLTDNMRLFYYDSYNDFDEIIHLNSRFLRFKPIPQLPVCINIINE